MWLSALLQRFASSAHKAVSLFRVVGKKAALCRLES